MLTQLDASTHNTKGCFQWALQSSVQASTLFALLVNAKMFKIQTFLHLWHWLSHQTTISSCDVMKPLLQLLSCYKSLSKKVWCSLTTLEKQSCLHPSERVKCLLIWFVFWTLQVLPPHFVPRYWLFFAICKMHGFACKTASLEMKGHWKSMWGWCQTKTLI